MQVEGRRGGGGLEETAQPKIPPLAFHSGQHGLGLVPTLAALGAPRSLKGAMVKDRAAPFSQLRAAFQFRACFTFPRYPVSQLGKGTGGV